MHGASLYATCLKVVRLHESKRRAKTTDALNCLSHNSFHDLPDPLHQPEEYSQLRFLSHKALHSGYRCDVQH